MPRFPRRVAAASGALLAAGVLSLPGIAGAATFKVTTTADTVAEKCATECSLRTALKVAADATEASTISVPAGTYALSSPLQYASASATALSIEGDGSDSTSITGPSSGSIFELSGSATLASFSDLTLRGGRTAGEESAAVDSAGVPVALANVVASDNVVTSGAGDVAYGGAVAVYAFASRANPSLSIVDSTFRGNAVKGAGDNAGGAVSLKTGTGTLDLNGVTFDGNSVEGTGANGGAVAVNGGAFLVRNSTFTANRAPSGAALSARAPSGATPADRVAGRIELTTIAANTGGPSVYAAFSTVTLRSSILAAAGAACSAGNAGTFVDAGSNLDSGTSCATAGLTNTDPQLQALDLRDFVTATMVPKPGSPVIDAVSGDCTVGDQRYERVRPADGNGDGVAACDIGSAEYVAPTPDRKLTDTVPTLTTVNIAGSIAAPDAPSTAYVEYGPTAAFGQKSAPIAVAALSVKDIALTLTDLTPGTTYSYRLVGNDGAREFPSTVRTFKTLRLPAIDGNPAKPVGTTTATLNGRVDPNDLPGVTWWFEYGSTPALGARTEPATVTGPSFVTISRDLGGLTPGTTYSWRLVARVGTFDIVGKAGSFTTLKAAPIKAPPTPIKLTVGKLKKYKIGKAYTVSATCAPGCTLEVALSVSPKTAKKLKLKSPVIASGTSKTGTVSLAKLTKKLARKLKARKPKSLTLTIKAQPKSPNAAATVSAQVVKIGK